MGYIRAMDNKVQTAYQKMLAESRARQERALAMRKDNKTMEEIGEALGVTHQRASQIVAQAEKNADR